MSENYLGAPLKECVDLVDKFKTYTYVGTLYYYITPEDYQKYNGNYPAAVNSVTAALMVRMWKDNASAFPSSVDGGINVSNAPLWKWDGKVAAPYGSPVPQGQQQLQLYQGTWADCFSLAQLYYQAKHGGGGDQKEIDQLNKQIADLKGKIHSSYEDGVKDGSEPVLELKNEIAELKKKFNVDAQKLVDKTADKYVGLTL